MDAPVGAPGSSENVSVCAGMSESLALAVKLRSEPSVMVLFPIEARTGAALLSVTTIVMVSKALRGGEPLSGTRMGCKFVVGPRGPVGGQMKKPIVGLVDAPAGGAP